MFIISCLNLLKLNWESFKTITQNWIKLNFNGIVYFRFLACASCKEPIELCISDSLISKNT